MRLFIGGLRDFWLASLARRCFFMGGCLGMRMRVSFMWLVWLLLFFLIFCSILSICYIYVSWPRALDFYHPKLTHSDPSHKPYHLPTY